MKGMAKESPQFPLLFSPLTIRGVTLRNRIVVLPMNLRFGCGSTFTDEDVAWYEARAQAGVGLIITGGTSVHEHSVVRGQPRREAFRRELIPTFAKLTEAVHRHGALIFGQLLHSGREAPLGHGDAPLWAPSAIPSPVTGQTPHAMTGAEIEEMIAAFTDSAENLLEAGYNGIELHGGHGYLIGQFLSGLANRREDDFGGSLAGRMRFPLAIASEIRKRCGTSFPLGIRISAIEELEGGLDLHESTKLARGFASSELIDYISVTVGMRGWYVKDMSFPNGYNVPAARAIRDACRLPVIVSQRITYPPQAEEILRSGAADLIGMARAHIADANWTRWARENQLARIVPCIGCVQDCRLDPGGVTCIHNPTSGRELEFGALQRARRRRTIVVVGGGPAGLEAARVAAERGHSVVLYERERWLGGQVALAANAPNRGEMDGVVSYRAAELDRLGVDVRLETVVSSDLVSADAPDAVVVATGAVQGTPDDYPVDLNARVIDLWTLLRTDAQPELLDGARTAVVIDDGRGSWETHSAAEFLAEAGLEVVVLTRSRDVAAGIPYESVPPLIKRLRHRNVDLRSMVTVSRVESGRVRVYDPYRQAAKGVREEVEVPSDITVLVGPKKPHEAPFLALARSFENVYAIGDCVSPRRISQAVLEGHRVARRL